MPTPGAAWFGIDALNNPSGDWPRRGGTVPYPAVDPDVMIPGLRALLDPRASVGERTFGGVMLGMTVLPGAGVAIRWVAVAARAAGAFRVAGMVTRGGAVFWRGVVGAGRGSVEVASSAAQAARLGRQLSAAEIAGGHAFVKHVVQGGQFPGVRTRGQFAEVIEGVMGNASHVRSLSAGRTAFWKDGVVVIRNPGAADGGTAFVPSTGFQYFQGLH